jgi:hypothetical protein
MSSEKTILLEIRSLINDFLANISETKDKIIQINQEINELDNNYFLEDNGINFSELCDIFIEYGCPIQNLTNTLLKYQATIEEKVDTICNHEWIQDEIDIDLDRSQTICYCNKCLISKKINKR